MITRTVPRVRDLTVPIAPSEDAVSDDAEDTVSDDDYLPGTEDWAVLESLRSTGDNAEERDAEDERFIALMVGGDAFD
jgi:hypothetical protein